MATVRVKTYCTVNVPDPVVPPEFAPMTVVPAATQLACPAAFGPLAIVATLATEELQWLFNVMSCVLPSLKVPVAVNCCTVPALAVAGLGVTVSDTNVPVPTVRLVVPLTPDADAVIVAVPPLLPCTIPVERTEATLGFDDFHETPARFVATLPSLNVPVAVSCREVCDAILGLAGEILIDTRCAVDTVSPVDPLIEPKAALMVVLPLATLLTTPLLLMEAAAGLVELHITELEISCTLLSLNVPVAVNCLLVPTAMVEFAGVTAIETRLAPVTVSEVVPLTLPEAAVMVVVPVPALLAKPVEFTVATAPALEVHVTDGNACVLPSSKLPVALNCSPVPNAIDGSDGLIVMEIRWAGTTVRTVVSVTEPTLAVMVVEPAASVAARPVPSTLATDVSEELHVTPLLRSELLPSL